MPDWNRREFIERSLGGAIAWNLVGSVARAAEVTVDTLLKLADPLLLERGESVPADANALPLLIQAAERLTAEPEIDFDINDDPERPNPKREQQYAAWVEANQASIDLFEQAAKRDRLSFRDEPWTEERVGRFQAYRSLARLIHMHSVRVADQRDLSQAIQFGMNAIKVFGLQKNGGGVLIEYIFGCACEGEAWRLLRALAYHPGCDADDVVRMRSNLPQTADADLGAQRAIGAEFRTYLLPELVKLSRTPRDALFTTIIERDSFETIAAKGEYERRCQKLDSLFAGHHQSFDVLDTARRASAIYAQWIRDIDTAWSVHRRKPDPMPSPELAAWPPQLALSVFDSPTTSDVSDTELETARVKLRAVQNPVGKEYLEAINIDSKSTRQAAISNRARSDGTRLFLAIRQFELQQGRLPATLDELVQGKLLDQLPNDPFNDKPFGYAPSARVLWSVGWLGEVNAEPPGEDDDEFDFEAHRWHLGPVPNPS